MDQSTYPYKNLVFEGGGVKGIAYGGALQELEQRGVMNSIERVAGTSAGAITAALVACGYSGEQAGRIIAEADFKSFVDNSWFVIRDMIRLIWRFGWNMGDTFLAWLSRLIQEAPEGKMRKNITFAEHHEIAQSYSKIRDLYVIGTNLSLQTFEVYSHEHTPDMEIRKAVRISMSFPYFFKAVREFRDTEIDGHIVRRRHVLIDGGLTCNYPLDLFDNDGVRNPETLGFRLGTRKKHRMGTGQDDWRKIGNIIGYSDAIKDFVLFTANRNHISDEDWIRTVFINTDAAKVLEFNLSEQQIDTLVEEGRKGVRIFFANLEASVAG